jgi:uncharacterized membrane protein YebE (DUF533 family)
MGLMDTIVKVGLGIAIAKGMQSMRGGRAGGGGGLGGMLQDMMKGRAGGQAGRGTPYSGGNAGAKGGLGGMMDQILGGSRQRGARANAPKGGLNDLLVGAGAGGALGGLFGSGGATALPEPKEETLEAALYLRCMIAAAKADGELDAAEKAKIMDAVGEASKAEIDFVNAELQGQTDVDALARQVPQGMEDKAYLAALMAIDLDQRAEAEFLHAFATALELNQDDIRAIHDRAGAPQIYG